MHIAEKTIKVEAPLNSVYNQWTQFEQFPRFMEGVEEVKQLDDKYLHWVPKTAATLIRRSADSLVRVFLAR